MCNGGDVTLKSLKLLKEKSPDTITDIFEYLHESPLYETVTAGDKDFLLVHSGIDNFSQSKRLSEYTAEDFLWAWPELDDNYFDDIITVFGHTPTVSYGKEYEGKVVKTRTWIDIDIGVTHGREPVLFRLDDFKEFYLY